ncbi:MAG: phosphodiester glycosidase family protein [Phycisphaerae bacterium]
MRRRRVHRWWLGGLVFAGLLHAAWSASHSQTRPASPAPAEPEAAAGAAEISPWKPVFIGVEMCRGSTTRPRPVQMRALRVDLKEPTIDLLVTPSNGRAPKEVNARTTAEFLAEFKCQAAINGSFFAPLATRPADPQDVSGLSISRGDVYSPPNRFDALLFSKDRRAWIDPAPVDPAGAYNALAGDTALLIDGQYSVKPTDTRPIVVVHHPRSAAGISRDGRYLILMTIDGRQPGYSEGASKAEAAEWLKRLGAWDAINLDGGGSSTLVLEGPDGKPLVLNQPCGPPPGTLRRVANHLGVFARKLPEEAR